MIKMLKIFHDRLINIINLTNSNDDKLKIEVINLK